MSGHVGTVTGTRPRAALRAGLVGTALTAAVTLTWALAHLGLLLAADPHAGAHARGVPHGTGDATRALLLAHSHLPGVAAAAAALLMLALLALRQLPAAAAAQRRSTRAVPLAVLSSTAAFLGIELVEHSVYGTRLPVFVLLAGTLLHALVAVLTGVLAPRVVDAVQRPPGARARQQCTVAAPRAECRAHRLQQRWAGPAAGRAPPACA